MSGKNFIHSVLKAGVLMGGAGMAWCIWKKSIKKESELRFTYKAYYELTNRWLQNRNRKIYAADYLKENNIKSVAIYGMGTLGELLYEELKESDIKIAYFIDRSAEELYYVKKNIPMVGIDDIKKQEAVDAIIVTPIFDFDTIVDNLEDKQIDLAMISLEEIIFNK